MPERHPHPDSRLNETAPTPASALTDPPAPRPDADDGLAKAREAK